MDMDQEQMKTMSGYFDLSAAGMIPSEKLRRQETERRVARMELKRHRDKAMNTLAGKAVLVCDPNPKDRSTISKNLQKAGFVVFTAETAKECEHILSSIPIHAIIADIKFPGVEIIEKSNNTMKIVIAKDPNVSQIALSNIKKVACPHEAVAAVISQ